MRGFDLDRLILEHAAAARAPRQPAVWRRVAAIADETGLSQGYVAAWTYRLDTRRVATSKHHRVVEFDIAPVANLFGRGRWIDVRDLTAEQRAKVEPFTLPWPVRRGPWVGERDLERALAGEMSKSQTAKNSE